MKTTIELENLFVEAFIGSTERVMFLLGRCSVDEKITAETKKELKAINNELNNCRQSIDSGFQKLKAMEKVIGY